MNISKRHIAPLGVAFLLIAIPAVAQSEGVVTFNAPFAFYAGDTQLPAGSYRVTQPDSNIAVLQIEAPDGSHSAFVTYRPVDQDTASSETMVSFKRYGNVDFLSHIFVRGQYLHIQIPQSQAEESAAIVAAAEEHSLPATSGEVQPTALTESQPSNGN
jgi:hypothetical protein